MKLTIIIKKNSLLDDTDSQRQKNTVIVQCNSVYHTVVMCFSPWGVEEPVLVLLRVRAGVSPSLFLAIQLSFLVGILFQAT